MPIRSIKVHLFMSLVMTGSGCSQRAKHRDPVDINTGSVVELAQLPAFDLAIAGAVLDYRRYHGAFRSVDSLRNVPGISNRFSEIETLAFVTPCETDSECGDHRCDTPGASGVCVRSDDGEVDFVSVASDGWNFAQGGETWVPVGANYDRYDNRVRLANYADELSEIDDDFAEMATFGFNAARISVHFDDVLSGPTQANDENLAVLDELLLSARRHEIKVDLTGLALYDRDAVADWLPALSDEQFRSAEKYFWEVVATRYAYDPTIFAYDLQNEPFVSETNEDDIVGPEFNDSGFHYGHVITRTLQVAWEEWVHAKYGTEGALDAAWGAAYPSPGESFDNIFLPGDALTGDARRADGIDFRNEHAAAWASDLKSVVREVDSNHLVTVAVAGPFESLYFYIGPTHLEDILDFMCVHLYPSGDVGADNVDALELGMRASHRGKPVVIEEIASYVDSGRTDSFLTRSLGSASGWFAFYNGQTADELRDRGGVHAGQAVWLERFVRFVSDEAPRDGATRVAGAETLATSIKTIRMDSAARQAAIDTNASHRAADALLDVDLSP